MSLQPTWSGDGDEALQAILYRFQLRFRNWRPALGDVARIIYQHEQDWLDSHGGGTWAPLAPGTIRQKEREGWPHPTWTLYRSGAMYRSLTSPHGPYSIFSVQEDELRIGVDWPVAQYHHEGKGRLPQRKLIVFTPALVSRIRKVMMQHLMRG